MLARKNNGVNIEYERKIIGEWGKYNGEWNIKIYQITKMNKRNWIIFNMHNDEK